MTLKSSMSANSDRDVRPAARSSASPAAVEAGAVGQAGQRVVVGLVVEALGVALARGDVDALGDVVVGLPSGSRTSEWRQRIQPMSPSALT